MVDGFFQEVDCTQLWVVGCVHYEFFVNSTMFAKSEYDDDVVGKVKDIRRGQEFDVMFK